MSPVSLPLPELLSVFCFGVDPPPHAEPAGTVTHNKPDFSQLHCVNHLVVSLNSLFVSGSIGHRWTSPPHSGSVCSGLWTHVGFPCGQTVSCQCFHSFTHPRFKTFFLFYHDIMSCYTCYICYICWTTAPNLLHLLHHKTTSATPATPARLQHHICYTKGPYLLHLLHHRTTSATTKDHIFYTTEPLRVRHAHRRRQGSQRRTSCCLVPV